MPRFQIDILEVALPQVAQRHNDIQKFLLASHQEPDLILIAVNLHADCWLVIQVLRFLKNSWSP